MKLSKIGEPEKTIEVSKEDIYALSHGDAIERKGKKPLRIDGGRESLLQNFQIDGQPITQDFLKQVEIDTRPPSFFDKITGHIPTLTDVGNRIVQGVGTLTGQLENPFQKQIDELEARKRTSDDRNEMDQIDKQIKTLKAIMNGVDEKDLTEKQKKYLKEHNIDNSGWSGYDVAKVDDVSAAPGALQGLYNVSKTIGDNLDVVDVGTAFLPVGAIGKGAAFVGKNAPKWVAKGAGKVASFATKHPILTDAGEQVLFEGTHGALTYKPEENESIGTNALEQGGLAGLVQGGVSALGGRRLRAVKALPENKKIEETLDELRKAGAKVPESTPMTRAGKPALTTEEAETLRDFEAEKISDYIKKNVPLEDQVVTEEELTNAIEQARESMLRMSSTYPTSESIKFKPQVDKFGNEGLSPWEMEYRSQLGAPYTQERIDDFNQIEGGKEFLNEIGVSKPGYSLKEILGISYSKPNPHIQINGIGVKPNPVDMSPYAYSSVAENILKNKGYVDPRRLKRLYEEGGVDAVADWMSNNPFKEGGEDVYAAINDAVQKVNRINTLEGLNYASKPLERFAETPTNKFLSQVPVVKHLPKIYETQTLPTLRRGDVAGAWERAKANLFLDELRELSEGGLDYLADTYGDK